VLGHFDAVTSRVSFFPAWQAMVSTLNASMGVICFFTLSGFLLTYLAAIEFRRTGRFDVRAFYVRRAFRIWPLHFTVLAVVMLLTAPFAPLAIERRAYEWSLEHVWMYVLFLNNWSLAFTGVGGYVDLTQPMLNISWSIAIEEQIYLVFPLLMLGIVGAARRRQVGVIAAVIAVSVAYRLIALLWWGPVQHGRAATIYMGTLSYLDVVLAGGLAGWLCAQRRLPGLAGGRPDETRPDETRPDGSRPDASSKRRPLPLWPGLVVLEGSSRSTWPGATSRRSAAPRLTWWSTR
jgi:peptidoglycan/LPS O-acetylase OafA/YrhL